MQVLIMIHMFLKKNAEYMVLRFLSEMYCVRKFLPSPKRTLKKKWKSMKCFQLVASDRLLFIDLRPS